jgi:hypothetical protein
MGGSPRAPEGRQGGGGRTRRLQGSQEWSRSGSRWSGASGLSSTDLQGWDNGGGSKVSCGHAMTRLDRSRGEDSDACSTENENLH